MKKLFLIIFFGALSFLSCTKQEPNPDALSSEMKELYQTVLVVTASIEEYEYFKQSIEKYRYTLVEEDDFGARYVGNRRNELSVRLLYPGATISGNFGIIQLKGHDRDMKDCLNRTKKNFIKDQSVIIAGGCKSSTTIRKDIEELGLRCISVDDVGLGPMNDYLTLQLHAALQDASTWSEAVAKVKERAPKLGGYYSF